MSGRLPTRLLPGRPDPLGATWDGFGVNFAVFSANAERIEVCVFDRAGRREIRRYDLPDCADEVFFGFLPDATPGLLYGYRAHGPYQPERGHRFNPNKLLIDPYAKALSGDVHWSDALFGYRVGSPRGDLSFDRRDSAAAVPKSIVVDEAAVWGDDRPPRRPWRDTVIYEMHLRGYTMQREDLPEPQRGTFAALGNPRTIDHLVKLGVTSVELLPVQAYLQDRFLISRGLTNYWGYSTLAFFAPENRYLAAQATGANEIRSAVRRLHEAGIEVIMDVVYNHTCEGSELGPTLSWRGLDNASYYRLFPGHERHFINDTGCGNTINITHPRVLQMVADSLRHWATAYRIDGFRFDLGTILGREAQGFDPGSGFFDVLRQDPLLSRLKLISEPWDLGPGGYQLGNHPPGFSEWNGAYRDSVRRFWRGDPGQRAEIAGRLMGSPDLFDHRRRRTTASVNFLTAHDGFTLADLVSYNERHNMANGEHNQDGHADNISYNWGVEGETEDKDVLTLRDRVRRAMLATLFFSYGTPMLLAGDEFGQTQGGNNNAYCQDNPIAWLDWTRLEEDRGKTLNDFVRRLADLRGRYASLRSTRFLHGTTEVGDGLRDVDWFDEAATPLTPDAWQDPNARLLAMRRAVREADAADATLILFNASHEDRDFALPQPALDWWLELDTATPDAAPAQVAVETLTVASRAIVLLGCRMAEQAPADADGNHRAQGRNS